MELFELADVKPVPEERKQPNTDLLTSGNKHMAFRVPDVQAAINELVKHGVKVVAVRRDSDRPMETRSRSDADLARLSKPSSRIRSVR